MGGFVYVWFDRKHQRFYVGSHWGTIDDGYVCSSQWMKRSYARRPNDFRRRIVASITTTRQDLLNEEYRWLQMIPDEELGGRYYNLVKHVGHWRALDGSKKIRERISENTKKAMMRPDVRERYEEGLRNRDTTWITPDVRRRKSESMKRTMALKYPTEQRRKRNKLNSPEHSENMRQASLRRWAKQKALST